MAVLTPCASPMDTLSRWPEHSDTLSTPELISLSGHRSQPTVYRWMMRLTVCGYFRRHTVMRPRGGILTYWTITDKGREAITELKRIHA